MSITNLIGEFFDDRDTFDKKAKALQTAVDGMGGETIALGFTKDKKCRDALDRMINQQTELDGRKIIVSLHNMLGNRCCPMKRMIDDYQDITSLSEETKGNQAMMEWRHFKFRSEMLNRIIGDLGNADSLLRALPKADFVVDYAIIIRDKMRKVEKKEDS
jgi:hypothetical protein